MIFDGVTAPDVFVELAIGISTSVDPGTTGFTLDHDHLDTGTLGSLPWVDVSLDCDRVSFNRGQAGEIEDPQIGQAQIVLDNYSGNYDPSNNGRLYTLLEVGVAVWIKAVWAGVTYQLFRGYVDNIQVDAGYPPSVTLSCTDGLEVLGRAMSHPSYPDGDQSGVRVGKILDTAMWPSGLRSIDTGYSQCQALSSALPAQSALSMLTDTVATDLGMLAVDGSGNVCFYDRLHVYTATRSLNVQATISDAGTDIDMLTLTMSRDRALVFNEARLTRNGGTEQVYDDSASQTKYGIRTWSGRAGTMLRTDVEALTLGSWIVGRFRAPVNRVTQVHIDGASQGMWASLLGLTYLDRIRVIRHYGAPNTITMDIQVVIIGMSMDISQDSWLVDYNTRNIDGFQPFILDTSKLNTGTLA